jgi:MinD superfamily P-loop ATPase
LREIVVLSGKGGTGKTVILASLASLAHGPVIADCDVDAPNLHLILNPDVRERGRFSSRKVAVIDGRKCNNCMECISACRFDALTTIGNSSLHMVAVNADACEGCGVCMRVCPSRAVRLVEQESGEWFVSKTRFGPMVDALLAPGGENSGKLVALVKQKAKVIANQSHAELVLVDGPPGLSCPAISAAAGADLLVLVAEPTLSGLNDFMRIADLCASMNAEAALIVNRWDINEKITESIEHESKRLGVTMLGRIPYDENVPLSIAAAQTLVEHEESPARSAMMEVWERLSETQGDP